MTQIEDPGRRPEPQASVPDRTDPAAWTEKACPLDETAGPGADPETARIRARFLCLFLGLMFLAVAVFYWMQGERTGFPAVCASLGIIFVHFSGYDSEQ